MYGGERLLVARVLDERAALGAAGLVTQHRALLDAPERLEQPPHLLLRLRLRQHAHEQLAVLCTAHTAQHSTHEHCTSVRALYSTRLDSVYVHEHVRTPDENRGRFTMSSYEGRGIDIDIGTDIDTDGEHTSPPLCSADIAFKSTIALL